MNRIQRRNLSKDKGIHPELKRTVDDIYDALDLLLNERRKAQPSSVGTSQRQLPPSNGGQSGGALLGVFGTELIGQGAVDDQLQTLSTSDGSVTSVGVSSNNAAIASISGSPVTSSGTIAINFSSTPTFTSVTLNGGLKWLGYTSSAAAPTTTELPADKNVAIHKDTGTSKIYLAFNDSGVIKKVELT